MTFPAARLPLSGRDARFAVFLAGQTS